MTRAVSAKDMAFIESAMSRVCERLETLQDTTGK
jgi:hypothetical protein